MLPLSKRGGVEPSASVVGWVSMALMILWCLFPCCIVSKVPKPIVLCLTSWEWLEFILVVVRTGLWLLHWVICSRVANHVIMKKYPFSLLWLQSRLSRSYRIDSVYLF
jgi:hypothetical protein